MTTEISPYAMYQLPQGVRWLELDGQRRFAVYGASGGLCYRHICYLIKSGTGQMPESLSQRDLGVPQGNFSFTVTHYAHGWAHASIWGDADVEALKSCLAELEKAHG